MPKFTFSLYTRLYSKSLLIIGTILYYIISISQYNDTEIYILILYLIAFEELINHRYNIILYSVMGWSGPPHGSATCASCCCTLWLPTPANATNAANPASNAEICERRDLQASMSPSNAKERRATPNLPNAENCDVT